jgi:DNA-binding response OmpR family regulator
MSAKAIVLIVEDDKELQRNLADQLSLYEDFSAIVADLGTDALSLIDRHHVDIVLLDVGLPDMDGRETCRLMRRRGVHAPIIMLTALDSDADVILGLDAGANDYIVKPFRIGVLLARIRAQLRQHEMSENAAFSLGPYIFKPGARLLFERDSRNEIVLSEKECAILKHLYKAGDAVVGCDELYTEIWDHAAPLATHTLQTHIYRLRQKIEPDPSDPKILKSEAGGYRVVR